MNIVGKLSLHHKERLEKSKDQREMVKKTIGKDGKPSTQDSQIGLWNLTDFLFAT